MEEEKPVTDLELLPHLEIVSLESLPKPCSTELILWEQQRRGMVVQMATNTFVGTIFGVGVLASICGYIWALLNISSAISLVIGLFSVVCLPVMGILLIGVLERHARDVRAYRQMVVLPQLQIGAGTESRYFDMAKLTNEMSVDLNIKMENEMRKDPSERKLKELQRKRMLLSENIEEIKAWANGTLKPKTK